MVAENYEVGQHKQSRHGGLSDSLHRLYRGTTFQVIILGLVSFTQSGIWSALNSLGAGGEVNPVFVNASYVVTFGIMIFFSPVAAVFGNRYNLRWILILGTIGYAPYCAALYTNSVYGTKWFIMFGAATCGFSAAALWTAEGAIVVGYPEVDRRGFCVALWLALNNTGSLVASVIELGLNTSTNTAGSISPKTYLVLVGLTCIGLPLSLLLCPAEKLIRRDGTKPTARSTNTPVNRGFRDFWALCQTRHMYMLFPIFITAHWGQAYNGNYLAAYFSVRGRTLAAFSATLIAIAVSFIVGHFLDSKLLRRSLRSKVMWMVIAVSYAAAWIYHLVNQADYQSRDHIPDFDWSSPGYGRAVGAHFLYRIGHEAVGTWLYWVLGSYDIEFDTLALTASILRAGESLGSACSYGAGASSKASLMTCLIIAAVLWFAAVPSTTYSAWIVKDTDPEGSLPQDLTKEDSAALSTTEENHQRESNNVRDADDEGADDKGADDKGADDKGADDMGADDKGADDSASNKWV